MTEEARIIKRCIEGESEAQHQLYNCYKNKMMGLCVRYVRNREDAQDVLQEGFIKVFRDLHTYKPVAPFEAWLRRVVINTALEYLRKNKKRLGRETSMYDEREVENLQGEKGDAGMSEQRLLAIINRLPLDYKMVFNLHAIEGYSHEETAKMLDIGVPLSKTRLSRARAMLREMLEKEM